MRLVRVSEPRMSSCLTGGGGGRTPPAVTSTTKTYGFDHHHHHHHRLDMELIKPTTATVTKSGTHSSPSSSSSSPSSTISEASDNQQQLSLSTKRPRTPRKRPNQTYNEAAALLSTAYPNIFSTTNLAKPPFKFSKRVEPNWGYATSNNGNTSNPSANELLVVAQPKPSIGSSGCNFFDPRLALGSESTSNRCTTPDSNPCQSSSRREEVVVVEEGDEIEEEEEEEEEFQFYQRGSEEYDFDAESILDEEIGAGIDSIIGNHQPVIDGSNEVYNQQQQQQRQTTTNFCYGIPMGLGLGLPSSSRFDFRLGIRAFRNVRDGGGGGMYGDHWWRCPVRTVEVGAISPRFMEKKEEEKEVVTAAGSDRIKSGLTDKKKSSGSGSGSGKKKKVKVKDVEEREKSAATVEVKEGQALPAERGDGSTAAAPSGRINLKLNYDEVISAWSDNGSMFSEDVELSGSDALARLAQIDLFGENGGIREASVQRYKEKRRNRLFSKKIVRYQVRKVNADQRPRVKGRFVRSPDSREDGDEDDKQT